ncbi:DNA-binding domain-containing protein [Pseudomonas entomophila]|uniref:HvfC/BufC N-terminal domain-containing protein n=1 Tax=Pseudomonas entomophila TaxID=312306 RepID=UPI0023D88EB9|nr:DNA-binding domain-containing protein [Pseudomonas entomophila]MDF0729555.1 DNA-binding domain-containing protein [Pseudomonas entomophila]
MTLTLGQFQDAFVEALYQRPAPALAALTAQPAFAVYRNTVLAGAVEALCANYPSIERLVGGDWMRAAATRYAEHSPPDDPRLVLYGADFPAFLQAGQAQHGLVYLADVACLDRCWSEAFSAPLEPALSLAELAGMSAADLAHGHLRPRASVRWHWCAEHPAYSLWQHSREGLDWPQDHPWLAQGVLFSGHADAVAHQALEVGGCAFLDACAAGQTLEQASVRALQAQPSLDFNDLLGRLLQAQALRPLTFS